MKRLLPSSRKRTSRFLHIVLAVVVVTAANAQAISERPSGIQSAPPDSLTSAEFWKFFTSMSEPDGYFLSENFVSNEVSFQEVIPALQRSLTKDGVYLGVGPEQNFTYISNLNPRMAVIFDIRRQNAMQHLMYKALFELSPTRSEFVGRLFSRPSVSTLGRDIGVKALFDSAYAATGSDSAYKANLAAIVDLLTVTHGFALPQGDLETIEHVFRVFFLAGPEVNYGYRAGSPGYMRATYPTYGMLQTATNADSVEMAFLATEENYQAVRTLQLRNLIVPVVGNFSGPSAIRSVGQWLKERAMTVTAFYVSNVEQYLFREDGAAERFYGNVSSLPLDSTSQFIRSVPRTSGAVPFSTFSSGAVRGGMRVIVSQDSAGNTIMKTYRDSTGYSSIVQLQTRVDSSRDSLAARRLQLQDSLSRFLRIRDSLVAAIAPGKVVEFRVSKDSIVARDTSIAATLRARRDSVARASPAWQIAGGPAMSVVMGGLLASGVASMQGTLQSFFLGELKDYNNVIAMTKVGR